MAELWPRYKPNDMLWHCPVLGCGHDNIDDPAETALPMCERCGECFEWSQITIKTTVGKARERHAAAQREVEA